MNKEMWADIFESLANSIRTMGDPKIAEKIDAIRKWADGRARLASKPEEVEVPTTRKLTT